MIASANSDAACGPEGVAQMQEDAPECRDVEMPKIRR